MTTAFTGSELDALRRAYAAGVLRVTYLGRSVEYGSASDLLSRIRVLERDADNASASSRQPVCGFSGFSRE